MSCIGRWVLYYKRHLAYIKNTLPSIPFCRDTDGWPEYLVTLLFSIPSQGSRELQHCSPGCSMWGLSHVWPWKSSSQVTDFTKLLSQGKRWRTGICCLVSKGSDALGLSESASKCLTRSHQSRHFLTAAVKWTARGKVGGPRDSELPAAMGQSNLLRKQLLASEWWEMLAQVVKG